MSCHLGGWIVCSSDERSTPWVRCNPTQCRTLDDCRFARVQIFADLPKLSLVSCTRSCSQFVLAISMATAIDSVAKDANGHYPGTVVGVVCKKHGAGQYIDQPFFIFCQLYTELLR